MIDVRLNDLEDALAEGEARFRDELSPWCVRLEPGEGSRLQELGAAHRVRVVDTIEGQLVELATVRLPGGTAEARVHYVDEMKRASGAVESIGVWVFLPWESTIAHLLARDDYFDVIVSRNHDKITRGEQAELRRKRVGVIGLSVGGESAVTVAQEHLCGEIVLADFDRLELSNLNRLGASFTELATNKAHIVARRIARIDPYIDVTVVDDGVRADNVDEFMDGLDLLIEECDDLQVKYDVREVARRRGTDIVYAADERGFLSVEPYSRCSELAPFHGRVAARPAPREAFESPLEFMKALTEWLGGWDVISERSRSSLRGLGETTCGYPQLASEARFAAGQIGNVARRLLLGEPLRPFVGNVDLDAIVLG